MVFPVKFTVEMHFFFCTKGLLDLYHRIAVIANLAKQVGTSSIAVLR